jgi:hypothetical protein
MSRKLLTVYSARDKLAQSDQAEFRGKFIGGQNMELRKGVALCRRAWLLGTVALAFAGCSSKAGPSGTVTGKVTYKGEPVPAGEVVFNLIGNDVGGAIAQINSDGTYKATGVPIGSVVVTVSTPSAPPTQEQAAKNPLMQKKRFVPKGENKKTVSIPPKYSRPTSSGLSLTVREGTQPYDIDLK